MGRLRNAFVVLVLWGLVVVALPAHASSSARLWIEPIAPPEGLNRLSFLNDSPLAANKSVSLICRIDSREVVHEALVVMKLFELSGPLLYTGVLRMPFDVGANECRFQIDSQELADGEYRLVVDARSTLGRPIVQRRARLRRISLDRVQTDLEDVLSTLRTVRGRLNESRMNTQALWPMLDTRWHIADAFCREASAALPEGDWRWARRAADYGARTAGEIKSSLVFANMADLGEEAAAYSAANLEPAGSTYAADGRPVFLVGVQNEVPWASEDARRLADWGLNFAVVDHGPETETSLDQTCAFLEAADSHNVAAIVDLGTQSDYGPEAAAHVQAAAMRLDTCGNVVGLSVAERPELQLDGEEVRKRFLAWLDEKYAGWRGVNQAWQKHYRSLDEVEIDWEQPRFAYQTDWQEFHASLVRQRIEALAKAVRETGVAAPVLVEYADDFFVFGTSRFGVEPRVFADFLDVAGVSVNSNPEQARYALDYPRQNAVCALLTSLAPGTALCNIDNNMFDGVAPEHFTASGAFDYVYSVLWEGAIAGLGASAAPGDWSNHSGLFARPEYLDAAATACLDLNRLAPEVKAFHDAPAPVAVLWSESSRRYDKGDPHLGSALTAYEGCGFFGAKVGFITETDCQAGRLADVDILVLPETQALAEAAFQAVTAYVADGGIVIRPGTQIPYDPYGMSREDVVPVTPGTVLVQGKGTATEHLHAMDAAAELAAIQELVRLTNGAGYPLEGVWTRSVQHEGATLLFVLNMRSEPVSAHVNSGSALGRDLITGRNVLFPRHIEPLKPMMVRFGGLGLEPYTADEDAEDGGAMTEGGVPSARLERAEPVTKPKRSRRNR